MLTTDTLWQKLLWLAAAGAAGTLARYGLTGWVHQMLGRPSVWGTVAVNAVGCFAFGLLWALAEQRQVVGPQLRLVILTGFMGAFTTFSTYAFETSDLARQSQWWQAAGNLVGQNALGLTLAVVGFAVGRLAWAG